MKKTNFLKKTSLIKETKMNKKGTATGDSVIMIYRLFLITFIALIILGSSAFFYAYYADIRNTEARILIRKTMHCLAPDGTLNLDKFQNSEKNVLTDYCDLRNTDRFYVKVTVWDEERYGDVVSYVLSDSDSGKEIKTLEHGDSGLNWIKKIFRARTRSEKIIKSKPGDRIWIGKLNIINEKQNSIKYVSIESLVTSE